MPSTSEVQSFHSSWQQTASWAQSKGIKYNQYLPVYNLDSQRLLNGSTPMSTAERERAIQAAADPQQAFQSTPSTASNPWNVIGNTITDARNIFTGLGDIVIHPLHNGLVDSLYNTYDLLSGAHKLQGDAAQKASQLLTGTVLSWIPGAADLGTLAQADNTLNPADLLFNPKGLAAEAQHPISTLLDIAPVLNKLAGLKVAASDTFAAWVGLAGEDAPKPSVFRVAKGYVMNTKLKSGDVGPTGKPLTVGDKLHSIMGGSVINSTPAIHDVVQGIDLTNNRGTFVQQYLSTPVLDALDHLDDEQKASLNKLMDPSQPSNLEDRIAAMDKEDPAVADAARAINEGPRTFQNEEILALPGTRLIEDPKSGKMGVFTQTGHASVIARADELQATTQEIARVTPELQEMATQGDKAVQVLGALGQRMESLKQEARQTDLPGNDTFPVKVHGAKHPVGFAKKHVISDFFDTGENVDKFMAKVNDGHYLEASALATAYLKRMDTWDPVSIDAADAPALQAVKTQLEQMKSVLDLITSLRKETERRVYGKGKIWTGEGKYRDEMHEEAAKTLKMTHDEQTKTLSIQRKTQINRLGMSYKILRRDISTKYANLKRAADDQIQEISERYGVAKDKATVDDRLARQAYQELQRGREAQRPRTADVPDAPLYHGTPRAFESGRPIPGYGRSAENLYGSGFYTTDSKEIAGSYTGKSARGDTSKTVYGMRWGGDTAPNLIDLEHPLPARAAQFLSQYVDRLEQGLDEEGFDKTGTLQKIAQNAPGKEVLRQLRSDLRAEGRLTADVDEVFDYISEELSTMGYDGLSHIGGLVAGGGRRLHQVRIFYDPNKLNILHSTDVEPRDPSETPQIAPGAPGSPEALAAVHTALDLQKATEMAEVTPKALYDAQMKIELKDSQTAEREMTDRLTRAYDQQAKKMKADQEGEDTQLRTDNLGKRAREGEVSQMFNDWTSANKDFADAVWKHPSDNNTDLYFNLLAKHIVKNEEATDALSTKFAEKHGYTAAERQALRSNPVVMGNLLQMELQASLKDPIFEDLPGGLMDQMIEDAKHELADLNRQGIFPEYIPHVSGTQLDADGTGSFGIKSLVGKGIPKPDALSARTWGMDVSRFDVMAGVQRGVKQVLDRKGTLSVVSNYLDKHITTADQAKTTIDTFYKDQLVNLSGESVASFYATKLRDWNLEEFDPESAFGVRLPRWGDGKVYIDKDLMRAVTKMNDYRSKTNLGIFDKATRLFRFSILGLSPRYTAHITLGGTFLLALRSSPYAVTFLGKAWKGIKTGEFDMDTFPVNTAMGTTEYELTSFKKAHEAFGNAAGRQSAHLAAGEHIEVVQGIKLAAAKPIHWVKALGDLNLHFTNYVTKLQRAVALLDGAAKAKRDFDRNPITDEWGNKVEMTQERAMMEGMKHAEAVFGDLRRMSPFERQVARTIVPFYGWEKHILQYVLSFPADHPWRAMMLANIAEYDTEHSPGGLPSRYQFLFFLGHPDAQGNVSAVDLRAMNPLRDVANYATWGGFFGSLNPVISGPIAAVDPSIVYGGNQLYPNLTYDQFYGIETAGPQGNLLTAAEQVVPQISAMQSALGLAANRQNLSGTGLVKNIYNSLNIPFAQVQHINLRQEAAKTAIAQYQVSKNLASQAWTTGNFGPIADLGSVPDPRNADYETPVSELEQMYQQLSQEYPGQPPSETATPLPSVKT